MPSVSTHKRLMQQVEALLEEEQFEEAIELLKPLAGRSGGDGEVQFYLANAYLGSGDPWKAVLYFDRASELSHNPAFYVPLAGLYLDLDLKALALQALRRVPKYFWQEPDLAQLQTAQPELEREIQQKADQLKIPLRRCEEGLRWLDQGLIALENGEYLRSTNFNRKAIETLGAFPPPHNNLALALFWLGKPQEALEVTQAVLRHAPDNPPAQTNLLRILRWGGREAEAQTLWQSFRQSKLADPARFSELIEAAAIMDDDEKIFAWLTELRRLDPDEELSLHHEFYLAVAEANLGKRALAKRHFRQLVQELPWLYDWLDALAQGKPGPFCASRFPYFTAAEILPERELNHILDLMQRFEQNPSPHLRSEINQFMQRFPQVILFGRKLLFESPDSDSGTAFLRHLATPDAYSILREFGLGQLGEEMARMQALRVLQEVGQISAAEPVRFWQDGDWVELQLRQFKFVEEAARPYTRQVLDLIKRGQQAAEKEEYARAEKFLLQAIGLDSRAYDAYNNLAVVYLQQDQTEQARTMLEKALEVSPLYVLARVNLAHLALDEEDMEKAEQILAPIRELEEMDRQSYVFRATVLARLFIHQQQFEQARQELELALQIDPQDEIAQGMLSSLEISETMRANWQRREEQQARRELAARQRQQQRLTSRDFSLAEGLEIYTKEALLGMGRAVEPNVAWSGLKKDLLRHRLLQALNDAACLTRVVTDLNEPERLALGRVLAAGGFYPWQEFAEAHDDDLKEPVYWNYRPPASTMGRLRLHGLVFEATVNQQVLLVIPPELRPRLSELLTGLGTATEIRKPE